MFRLFRPQMAALLRQRDKVVAAWAAQHPGVDVFEDRALEITGYIEISVDEQLECVRDALRATEHPPLPDARGGHDRSS